MAAGLKPSCSREGPTISDVDRRRVEVDALVDPAQPAVRVLQLPLLIVVLRQKADGCVHDEGEGEGSQDRRQKLAHCGLLLRNARRAVERTRVCLCSGSRRSRIDLRVHGFTGSFPIEPLDGAPVFPAIGCHPRPLGPRPIRARVLHPRPSHPRARIDRR